MKLLPALSSLLALFPAAVAVKGTKLTDDSYRRFLRKNGGGGGGGKKNSNMGNGNVVSTRK